MSTLRRALPPLLLAGYAVLAVLAPNARQLEPGLSLRALALALAGAGLALAVLRLLLRDPDRAAVLTWWLALLFFTYGHAYALLQRTPFDLHALARHRFLAPLWVALALAGALWIVRRLGEPARAGQALMLVSAAALAFPLIGLLAAPLGAPPPAPVAPVDGVRAPEPAPDLIYIVLDAYARQDMLGEVYGLDNRPFIEALEAMGFYVAARSRSNYAQTALSLASSLNLDTIEGALGPLDPDSTDERPLAAAVRGSRVRRTLEALGYEVVSLATGYAPTEWRDADRYLAPQAPRTLRERITGPPNAFETLFIQTTALAALSDLRTLLPFGPALDLEAPYREHRERILFALERLADLPRGERPRFIFVHLVAPHPPFVFDGDGEPLAHDTAYTLSAGVYQGDREGYLRGYADQVTYLNRRLLETLEALLARADPPPIILIQADHGPDASGLGEAPAPVSYLDERFAILNAYLLSGCEPGGLYPEITPLNSFRVVWNRCFGAELPLLDDRSWISPYGRPYDLTEVTGQLR